MGASLTRCVCGRTAEANEGYLRPEPGVRPLGLVGRAAGITPWTDDTQMALSIKA